MTKHSTRRKTKIREIILTGFCLVGVLAVINQFCLFCMSFAPVNKLVRFLADYLETIAAIISIGLIILICDYCILSVFAEYGWRG